MIDMNEIKWGELPFGYFKTDYNVRTYFRNGKWEDIEVSDSEYIPVHIAATGLHYGQESFEGLKAFMGVDGKVRVFRWEDNCKRMASSAHGIMMAEVTPEVFKKAVWTAVQMNKKYIPPYGTGASLYIRPLLFGSGAEVGVKPAAEYMFLVFVTPVGPYFKEVFKPVSFLLTEEFDRAAPLGTGHIKVGGNYAAGLRAIKKAHDGGFANVLFLDAKEKKFIDEAGACGSAAIISPVKRIVDDKTGKEFLFGNGTEAGQWSTKLYKTLLGIQNGEIEDKYGWTEIIEV